MYAGNATIVSCVMRWPVLIPFALGCALIVENIPAPSPPPPVVPAYSPPPEPVTIGVVKVPEIQPAPIPKIKKVLPPIESRCPNPDKIKYLSKAAKAQLREFGCIGG
jgi:hypothetical protein